MDLPPAHAYVIPIGVTKSRNLAFGTFVAGTGGTVTIGTTGARSKTLGVVLTSGNAGSSGQFTATGDAGASYAITLPADHTVTLTSDSHTMEVNGFTSSAGASGILTGGSQTFTVGAALSVGNAQPGGSYTGSFEVTVNYE